MLGNSKSKESRICFFIHIYSYSLVLSCIDKKELIHKFVIWRDEYYGGNIKCEDIVPEDRLTEDEIDGCIWIVEGDREEKRLLELKVPKERIFRLFNEKHIHNREIQWIFDKKRFVEFELIHAFYYGFPQYTGRIKSHLMHLLEKYIQKKIEDIIVDFFKGYENNYCVLGHDNLWKRICKRFKSLSFKNFNGEFDTMAELGRDPITNLLYIENKDDFAVLCVNRNTFRKTEEFLLDNGFSRKNIQIIGRLASFHGSGSAALDIYDCLLGSTRELEGEPMGFRVFSNDRDNRHKYVIFITGGSTTDPTTANIKSWGEYLFDSLNSMKIPIEIWVGGISAYTVSQELLKLVRDGSSVKPNLVLSYSGVNDSTGGYYDEIAPFIRFDNKSMIKQGSSLYKRIGNGVKYQNSRANHWFTCECMMHGISLELGARFYGILQPWNEKGSQFNISNMDSRQSFYREAKELIKQKDFLLDYTGLFDDSDDYFFDCEHVYEKGNRKIARKVLPIVLKDIKEGGWK